MRENVKKRKRNRMIDLHLHTTASDGVWTPKELLEHVKAAGVTTFAVTDHDVIDGALEMKKLTENEDITFIFACEIACMHKGIQYHITSYDFDEENPELLALIRRNQEERTAVDALTIKVLHDMGHYIDVEAFETYEYDPKRGGWPALNFLIDQGVVNNIGEFFKVVPPEIKFTFHTPEEVINTVHKAGGYAVLAHPNAYKKGARMTYEELDEWKERGIDAIECYTPYNKEGDAKYYSNYCKKNNVGISGGSDCHGGFIGRAIGRPRVEAEQLRLPFLKTSD